MKKSRYSDSQIINILKKAKAGVPIPELCRTRGMAVPHFINGVVNMTAWMLR